MIGNLVAAVATRHTNAVKNPHTKLAHELPPGDASLGRATGV
jgi:hypothetical protein